MCVLLCFTPASSFKNIVKGKYSVVLTCYFISKANSFEESEKAKVQTSFSFIHFIVLSPVKMIFDILCCVDVVEAMQPCDLMTCFSCKSETAQSECDVMLILL